jgi:transcriptional regulator with XRE-family HTH domain
VIDVNLNRFALSELRERSGFSKSAFSREAGVSVGTVADLESGRRRASPAMLRRLATTLKVPLAAILGCPHEERYQ